MGFRVWDEQGQLIYGGGLDLLGPRVKHLTRPPVNGWSWVNQGAATIETLYDGRQYLNVDGTAGHDWRLREMALPSGNYTIKAVIAPMPFFSSTAGDTPGMAVGWRENTSGELLLARVYSDPTALEMLFDVIRMNSPTSASGVVYGPFRASYLFAGFPIQLWLSYNGTDLIVDYSAGGVRNQYVYSEAAGAFLTPDKLCWGASSHSTGGFEMRGELVSWWQGGLKRQ